MESKDMGHKKPSTNRDAVPEVKRGLSVPKLRNKKGPNTHAVPQLVPTKEARLPETDRD
jgi:hypothetical protein